MQPREIFEIWAPENSVWSPWAKPVIFAQMKQEGVLIPPAGNLDYEVPWASDVIERTALIINLPGEESVQAGLALAKVGYRPVPLYNTSLGVKAVIDVDKIITKLVAGTDVLRGAFIDGQASPAFLIDSERLKGVLPPQPGMYDNRWVVWPQDFPSAVFLRSKGIERVTVVQEGTRVQDDLAQVLTRWQRDKIEVLIKDIGVNGEKAKVEDASPVSDAGYGRVVPFQPAPLLAFWFWTRMIMPAALGLRRSSVGGFGGIVPVPGSGG